VTPEHEEKLRRQRIRAKRWRLRNPKSSVRLHRLKAFGLTPDQYQAMVDAQGGVCAICGCPEVTMRAGLLKTLAVDHCHRSGKIRSLLCERCNTVLGKCNDDVELVEKILAYLKQHEH